MPGPLSPLRLSVPNLSFLLHFSFFSCFLSCQGQVTCFHIGLRFVSVGYVASLTMLRVELSGLCFVIPNSVDSHRTTRAVARPPAREHDALKAVRSFYGNPFIVDTFALLRFMTESGGVSNGGCASSKNSGNAVTCFLFSLFSCVSMLMKNRTTCRVVDAPLGGVSGAGMRKRQRLLASSKCRPPPCHGHG